MEAPSLTPGSIVASATTPDRALFSETYRPKTLADVPIPAALRTTLQRLISINCLDVLLYGTQSSGKSTLARILTDEYFSHQTCPQQQVLFVNSLHEQGIKFYRTDMKQFCRTMSSVPGKKKLVVIDDIDLISDHIQQIIQTYISDYSKSVSFILVCSNLQKVADAIQSRVNIVRVPLPTDEDVYDLVHRVTEAEAFGVGEEVQRHIVSISGRSVKAAFNCLEKLYLVDAGNPAPHWTIARCDEVCADITNAQFTTYLSLVYSGDLAAAIAMMFAFHDRGFSVVDILDCFYANVLQRTDLCDERKYKLFVAISAHMAIFYNVHEHAIELALFTHKVAQALA